MANLNYTSIYTPRIGKSIKRLASLVLDYILIIIIFTGVLYLLSAIFKYDDLNQTVDNYYLQYGVLVKDEAGNNVFCNIETESCKTAINNLTADTNYIKANSDLMRYMYFAPIAAIFVATLIIDLIFPLCFKNHQTVGMKIFNLSFLSKNEIRITKLQLFIRFLFGRFIFNGVIPVFAVSYFILGNPTMSIIILAMWLIANIIVYFYSKQITFVSNSIASVMVVDTAEQIFFDKIEDLNKAREDEKEFYMKGNTHGYKHSQ